VSGELTWVNWIAIVSAILLILIVLILWQKGRPFAAGDVFRASRFSRGNRVFPTQVQITPTSVVQYTPDWIGKQEETIHMAHVSSVKISTGMLFSDVLIETSGGSHPIRCYGHHKRDAVRMKHLIEQYQTAYYRGPKPAEPGASARTTPPNLSNA
jgi:hypothetical protein